MHKINLITKKYNLNVMKPKVASLLWVLLLFPMMSVMAQSRIVKGIVKDTNGEPLIGVSVLVKGTFNGVTTNIDGAFSLEVNNGDKLQFSYIGYRTLTLDAPASGQMNAVLLPKSWPLKHFLWFPPWASACITVNPTRCWASPVPSRSLSSPFPSSG